MSPNGMRDLSNWTVLGALPAVLFAMPMAVSGFVHEDDSVRWSTGHRVFIGIALLEISLIVLLIYHPWIAYQPYRYAVELIRSVPVRPWMGASAASVLGAGIIIHAVLESSYRPRQR